MAEVSSMARTPPARGCPLLDKCPTEIRLKIFGIVLQTPFSLIDPKYSWNDWRCDRVAFNTALFTVCRTISLEAQDVFYEINTIRIACRWDPYETRTLIRHVEFDVELALWMLRWPGKNARIAVDAFSSFPKLKSMSIVTHRGYKHRARLMSNCVRYGKAGDTGHGYADHFLSPGVIQIPMPSPHAGKIFLKDFMLLDMLIHAKRLLNELSLEELYSKGEAFFTGTDRRGKRVIQTSRDNRLEFHRLKSALWIAGFDIWRAIRSKSRVTRLERKVLEDFFSGKWRRCEDLKELANRMPIGTRLVDLNGQDHGQQTLGLASDMMRYYLPVG